MTNDEIRIAIAKEKGYGAILSNDGRTMIASATGFTELPDWPGNIADAWELIEEMIEHGAWFDIRYDKFMGWWVAVDKFREDTAPLAICLAWLAWKEAQE